MTKDRKTLTDADIVSRRKGTPAKQGEASDADAPRAASDSDAEGHKAPPKAVDDKGDARPKGGDKGGRGHD